VLAQLIDAKVQFIRINPSEQTYMVNWKPILKAVQATFIESLIESSMGVYHTRVLRILKTKGFLSEVAI